MFESIKFKGNHNFLGLPNEDTTMETAKAVILPVPYDSTTSYRSGTRDGPGAILAASRNVELYDIQLGCEPLNFGVHTLPELEPDMSGPGAMVESVESAVGEILRVDKLPVILGGEHSLSTGSVRALEKHYGKNLSILQLDAHADLRDSYENTPFNHASVMRRVMEIAHLVQVGIRNISKGEMAFVKETRHDGIFWAHDMIDGFEKHIPQIVERLKTNVFISIDLDVFDPSIMPAVGTPEPGGLNWQQVLALLHAVVDNKNVIGFDVMELCPIPGNIAPDFLAAKLVFKLLGEIFRKNAWISDSGEQS